MSVNVQKRWSTDQLITGIELQDWLKLLGDNRFRVDPTYIHRAAFVGGLALGSSIASRIEDMRFGRKLASVEIGPEPLFVLGHWRSGTTHLHNLLGRMPGHTYPTVYQCIFPGSFLSTTHIVQPLTQRFMDDTRTYDNVKHGWNEAAEDEIALAKMTGLSPYIAFMFPGNAAKYEKYVDFLEVRNHEKDQWKEAFRYFIKKIMLQTGGQRVVVKSCTHTARIRMILEMFPNAKFVHIHRHPYEVFASTLHMRSHTDWENFFHLPEQDVEYVREQQTLLLGQSIFDRVTADRHLIPEENFYEIPYEQLVGHEMDVVKAIYDQFELPGWSSGEATLQAYVDGLKGYKRNKLKLPKKQRQKVYEYWRSSFDAYGYDPEYKL